MKWKSWLERWGMTSLKISTPFLSMEFKPHDPDRAAAWDLYVELLTRSATQPLSPDAGSEQTALTSVHKLFQLTRETLKRHGRQCEAFAPIAVAVLNQVVRPFTSKWHALSIERAFDDPAQRAAFREELAALQIELRKYTLMLADMAGVEDLTDLVGGS